MPRLSFDVTVLADCPSDCVVVAGTDPALGDWQPEKGLALECDSDGHWRGSAEVPHGLVEFKITRGKWSNEETYRDGTPCLNYQYLVIHDLTVTAEVEHWRDCEPWPDELIRGRAIECELDATQLGEHRRVHVWLPPGYLHSNDSRHPVLYLLDGQDSLLALSSPENETLETDEWVCRLHAEELIPELILVAVCHSEGFGRATPS